LEIEPEIDAYELKRPLNSLTGMLQPAAKRKLISKKTAEIPDFLTDSSSLC